MIGFIETFHRSMNRFDRKNKGIRKILWKAFHYKWDKRFFE